MSKPDYTDPELCNLFVQDAIELTRKDSFREFIFVSHNYFSEYLDKMLTKFFILEDKRATFIENFSISEFSFYKKLLILKNAEIIPKEFFKVLDDYNDIRNAVAHNVDWSKAIEERKRKRIKHDKQSIYTMVAGIFAILSKLLELSEEDNILVRREKIQEIDSDFKPGGLFYHWISESATQ